MEAKCFFWDICGPGAIRQAWSKKLSESDERIYYFSFFCCNEDYCIQCAHYHLREEEFKKIERRCEMIILMDADVWQKMRDCYEQGTPKNGTVIVEGHLVDSHLTHPVCDLAGKRVLGRAELKKPIHADINKVALEYIKAAGFPDRLQLKRSFQMSLQRQVRKITVAECKIDEVEPHWCPASFLKTSQLKDFVKATNGSLKGFLGKIFKEDMHFFCSICCQEISITEQDLKEMKSRLEKYPEADMVMLPVAVFKNNERRVLAATGDNWKIL